MKPLAIDLFCGLGGWTEGLLAEGWSVIGFDIERHEYGAERYPSSIVLQDVLTIHGSQFKNTHLIVASPPCKAYSYRAMPWSRAKALPPPDNSLFDACFRIQREANEAAGRHIPLVVENMRGAQKWVGRAQWNFGSFYLWGDVPVLMPTVSVDAVKVAGLVQKRYGHSSTRHLTNPSEHHERGVKGFTPNGEPLGKNVLGRKSGSKSSARKAASAKIAKIPFVLARYIASVYFPDEFSA